MTDEWRLAGRTPRMGVLMAASEMAPWAKTGGLADVLAGLPAALTGQGHRVTVVLPRYGHGPLPAGERMPGRVAFASRWRDLVFHIVEVSPRLRVVFVECRPLYDREGFYEKGGRDHPDNAERFAVLALAALEFAQHDPSHERVDVIHSHDWQAGLVPAFVRTAPQRWPRVARAGLVHTIHNLAYQGVFPREVVPALGLDWGVFTVDGGEFWGKFSFLKAGITFSDYVTTVSPSYAAETLTRAGGVGFDGVLAARGDRYLGILNGIDAAVWNPATDPLLPAHFNAEDLAGKRVCKRALLERFGLPLGDDALARPVIGLVSRLVNQKGLDLIEAAMPVMLEEDASWVFVGSGDPRHESFVRNLTSAFPARVGSFVGFSEPLAHLVEAGADLFLMPSRFEPCGLNQMYSLRYGTVPIVHAVGGLEDTVRGYTGRAQSANGFKFRDATPDALARTVRQALRVFADRDAWQRLMRQGMREDHSWETSAGEYVKVYRRARHQAGLRWAE